MVSLSIKEDKKKTAMGQAMKSRNDVDDVVDAVWSVLKSVDQVTANNNRQRPVTRLDRSTPELRDAMDIKDENALVRDPDCLAVLPQASLKKLMEPITDALHRIDAVSLLGLQRATNGSGPQIDNNEYVRPIYDRIRPPINSIENTAGRSCVRYLHIEEIPDQYSMGIFIFAPGAKIPLHDHPNMCVLSRVLYGSLERLSLDLARDEDGDDSQSYATTGPVHNVVESDSPKLNRPHRRDSDGSESDLWFQKQNAYRNYLPAGSKRGYKNHVDTLHAPDVTVLYPFEGNLHEFVAGPGGAAVLDVLVPPYDHINNRDCSFYHIRDVQFSPSVPVSAWAKKSQEAGKSPCYIVPTGQPEDFHCISGQYGKLGSSGEYES